MISPTRCLLPVFPLYYPFGNSRVRNVLKDLDISDDKEHKITKILFLGSSDLRNTLQATTNKRIKHPKLHIHLNDCNVSVVARNVMLLSIISAREFDPSDESKFAFLWDLWYNSEWPETTRKKFKRVLKDLLDGRLPENIVFANSDHLELLKETWSSWRATSSRSPKDSALFMKKIAEERTEFLLKGWNHQNNEESSTPQVLDKIADNIVGTIGPHLNSLHDSTLKQKMFAEARLFMEKGSCGLQNSKAVCVNPTLLNPTTLQWHVHYALSPYAGYLPLSRKEMDVSVESKILIRSCQKILRRLVSSYRRRLKDVQVLFSLEDALEYCYTERSFKFDVIDCSDLADDVGLVNLINACKLCLADHAGAQILTETTNWRKLTHLEYIQGMLCCPISMIPTMYGLRLTNDIQTGDSNLQPAQLSFGILCWKNAAPLRNVRLYSSATLINCLKELANSCYLKEANSSSIMHFSTPLTFQHVISSCAQRITGSLPCLNEVVRQISGPEWPPVFRLSKRTLESWESGRLILKLSAYIDLNKTCLAAESLEFLKTERRFEPAILRLILFPAAKHDLLNENDDFIDTVLSWEPPVHFIDNLELKMETCTDSIKSISVTFFLVPDHGLEETHFCGMVLDLKSRIPVFIIESIDQCRIENYEIRCPYQPASIAAIPKAPSVQLETLVAENCVETENDYTIQVGIISRSRRPLLGLNVRTDQQPERCNVANGLTVSMEHPRNISPVKISLPSQFFVHSVKANYQDGLVFIVLQKAIGPNPCSCDFHRNNTLPVNQGGGKGNCCSCCCVA